MELWHLLLSYNRYCCHKTATDNVAAELQQMMLLLSCRWCFPLTVVDGVGWTLFGTWCRCLRFMIDFENVFWLFNGEESKGNH